MKTYPTKTILKHLGLFLLTLLTTTLAGAEWLYGKTILSREGEHALTMAYFLRALHFSVPFLFILLVHELGHLLTALHHKVKSSLPFFIPGWLGFLGAPSLGTFGAIIQMKGFIRSRRQFFDIGVAGPLAGFVVALALLVYGFLTLPEADYIYSIHPEYADPNYAGPDAESGMVAFELGYNALFWLLEKTLADPERMPEIGEVIHYPYLFAGYLALFFTALNLLPVGQLDGGHVIYGLFPKRHKEIALTAYTLFIGLAGLGLIHPQDTTSELLISIPLYVGFLFICYRKTPMHNQTRLALVLSLAAVQYLSLFFFPNLEGYAGWLFFAFILGRVLGIYHPEVVDGRPLDRKRKILAWIGILIFLLCFTPRPFTFDL